MNPLQNDASLLFAERVSEIPVRGIHLDLKGLPPTFSRLLRLIELFEQLRINAVLVEWEDTFPWRCDESLRGKTCYSSDQVRQFAHACAKRNIEIIPLIQCMGHAENVLSKTHYRELREVPSRSDVFHPLHPGTLRILRAMISDMLGLLPDVKRFHLGCDEVWTLGQNPASAAGIRDRGVASLYMAVLDPLMEGLTKRGIRPLLWHDEVATWTLEEIRRVVTNADLMVWGYSGHPADPEVYHYRLPAVEKLQGIGAELWAATAFKGAEGPGANTVDGARRSLATQGWCELHKTFQWKGIVATGWSRYSTGRIQVAPMDAALHSLVWTAASLYHGGDLDLEAEVYEHWLDLHGEGENYRRCHEAMEKLTLHCDKAWKLIRDFEEQSVNVQIEPERSQSGVEETIFQLLEEEIAMLKAASMQGRELLSRHVQSVWSDYYYEVRCKPIVQAFLRLKSTFVNQKEE